MDQMTIPEAVTQSRTKLLLELSLGAGFGVDIPWGARPVWRRVGHMDQTEILLGGRMGKTDAGQATNSDSYRVFLPLFPGVFSCNIIL